MKIQKITVLGVLVLSSVSIVYAENTCISHDYLQDYIQDYKDDIPDNNSCDSDMMHRVIMRDGYSDGYSQDYACDYTEDIFDDLFLPLEGYTYTQPDEASPSRFTVFFASLGMDLLFAYCKVKAWFARHCCGKISQDISVDISSDTCNIGDQ